MKISIIVPVYNVEEYVSNCLQRIIDQTYKKLEIILINDGSTDRSGEICESFARQDKRIKLINKENGGLSDARNVGLKAATGVYTVFVDSDDLISPHFCERMLDAALANNADIVECDFVKFTTHDSIRNTEVFGKGTIKTYSTEQALALLMQEELKQVVWNKIYRSSVLANLQFPKGKINEDEYWTYKVFGNSTKIAKMDVPLYFYRQQPNSIMAQHYSIKRLDGLDALEERIEYMETYFPQLRNLAEKIFCVASMWHYQKISKHHEADPHMIYRNRIWNNMQRYNKRFRIKYWSINDLLWFQFFSTSPRSYAKLRNFMKIGV